MYVIIIIKNEGVHVTLHVKGFRVLVKMVKWLYLRMIQGIYTSDRSLQRNGKLCHYLSK